MAATQSIKITKMINRCNAVSAINVRACVCACVRVHMQKHQTDASIYCSQ